MLDDKDTKMSIPCDWQTNKETLTERGQYLLESELWSDCNFIVGEEPQQQTLKVHKLFLAMSSPVFEAMFFGGMAEKSDTIPIRDVQPEAFKALLKYIYTDKVELSSFELACELCYCAKKYMLPSLVKECTRYIWSDLSPMKVCRAYEFAKLFEESVLMDKCLQIMCTMTSEVLLQASWEEVDLATLLTILDQDKLEINSEVELFSAVERWAKAECCRKSLDAEDGKVLRSVIGNAFSKLRFLSLTPQEFAQGPGMSPMLLKEESFAILMNILCTGNKTPIPENLCTISNCRGSPMKDQMRNLRSPMFGDFFTLTQYIYGRNPPDTSLRPPNLLADGESSITLRNTSPILVDGGANKEPGSAPNSSTSGSSVREISKYYCLRPMVLQTECLNSNRLDCSVSFSVDKNICVVGVQVPTQISGGNSWSRNLEPLEPSYTEVLYAHLLDCDGTRLTYTHFTTKAFYGNVVEITFDRPVYIQRHKNYRVGVVFNKAGWYPLGVCSQNVSCDTVFFTFGVGNNAHTVRESLIRSIVFTYH